MRNFLVLEFSLLIAALAFSAFAQAGEFEQMYSPLNAYGPAKQAAPEGARIAGPNELFNRFIEGVLILDTPLKGPDVRHQMENESRQLAVRVNTFLAFNRPTLLYRISQIKDGADAPAQLRTALGENKKIVLMGRDAVQREIVGAQEMFMDRANQRALYDYLQTRLAGDPDLPSVSDIITADANALRQANEALLPILEARFARDAAGKPSDGFGACETEEGSGVVGDADDGDQTGKACPVSATGLFASGDWALKTSNTCVRNQGERGTSSAFALTAAIESRIARDEMRYSNLSEQHLFHQMTSRWFRVIPDNQDNIAPILSSGIASTIGYSFHFEDIWHYNASYDRTQVERNGNIAFDKACHWYDGRHCSQTNHQGRMLCSVVGENRYCGYDSPMPITTPVKVSNLAVVYEINNPDQSLTRVRRLLRAGVPIVMTFGVQPSLLSNKNGYVSAHSESERYVGGQAALISGFIPNHLRPPGAPEGEGGGLFIMKNSWGRCAGDAGYYYLPADWVKAHAFNMTAVF